jgi:hypothetical protein
MVMGIRAKLYGRRYPWRRWFRLQEFTLVRYTDFNGMAHTMCQQVRNAATRLGVKVSVSIAPDGSTVAVRVKNPLPSPPPGKIPPQGRKKSKGRVGGDKAGGSGEYGAGERRARTRGEAKR